MKESTSEKSVKVLIVSAISEEDLGYGMDLAAIAGQLWTVSDVVAALGMPVLADFLEVKGEELQNIAVETLLRFGATRALADNMGKTSSKVGELGAEEVVEGATRLGISDEMAARSDELAKTSADLTAQGLAQMAAASGMRDAAEVLVVAGTASIAGEVNKLSKAETPDAAADELNEKAT